MDIPAMFRAAVAEFDARIRQIGDHQWQAATPDEDWAVRDLVNHVAVEDLWAPPLLAGSTGRQRHLVMAWSHRRPRADETGHEAACGEPGSERSWGT